MERPGEGGGGREKLLIEMPGVGLAKAENVVIVAVVDTGFIGPFKYERLAMHKSIVAIGVSGLVMVALAGCQGGGKTGSTTQPDALTQALASSADFRNIVQYAKDRVFPTVAFIKVQQESMEGGRKVTRDIVGSGAVISATGEILTNWHVIDKATEVRVLLADGQHYDATVVGSDKDVDLALLQLKMPKDAKALPFATLGASSALREGDVVMAMGAPLGLSRSVSLGIVSCTKRYLAGVSEYVLWLQSDASISPGNSGGPLVNTQGEIIGVNTRGTGMGDLGFAIPSQTISQILPMLRKEGKVNWAWTGLYLQPLHDFDQNVYFEGDNGVMVADTEADSPARKAGLQPRDRIVKIGEHTVMGIMAEDLPDIRRHLGMLEKNQPVAVTLVRAGKEMKVTMTPMAKGDVEGATLACARWDMSLKTINQFDNPDLYFHRKAGVFVFGLKYPGNGATSGLRRDDIVLKIDGQEVNTLADVKRVHTETLANIDAKPRIVFVVLRNGQLRQIVVDIATDYSRE